MDVSARRARCPLDTPWPLAGESRRSEDIYRRFSPVYVVSPELSRRELLAGGLCGLVATAGCTDVRDGGAPPTNTTTETTTGADDAASTETDAPSATATAGRTPRIGSVRVTDSVVHVVNVDGFEVAGSPDDTQLVFATYQDEDGVEGDRFRLVVDGDIHRPQPPGETDFRAVARTVDRLESGQGLTGFVVPVRESVERVTLEYGESDLARDAPADARERLTADPVFEVRRFSLPDSVEDGEPVEAELTVANVGTGDGVFRATAPAGALGATIVERELEAGEEETFSAEVDLRSAPTGSPYGVTLSWADGRERRTTTVEPVQTEGE